MFSRKHRGSPALRHKAMAAIQKALPAELHSLESRRLFSAGALDPTFNGTGQVTEDFGSFASGGPSAIQHDGKILIAGLVGDDIGIARYLPNGTLDSTFNGTGKVILNIGDSDLAVGIAQRADGKIIVAGQTGSSFDLFAAALNDDGSLDSDFGGGIVTISMPDDQNAAALSVDSSGNAFLLGYGDDVTYVAKFGATGVDQTFGTAGVATIDFAAGTEVPSAIAVQGDGKLVIGGNISPFAAVGRLNADGTIDSDFGSAGTVSAAPNLDDQIGGITIDAAGNIITSGYHTVNGTDFAIELQRFTSTGAVDSSFGGGDGWVDLAAPQIGQSLSAGSVTIDTQGRIVTAGTFFDGTNNNVAVARFTAAGTVDSTFGTGGYVTTNITGQDFGGSVNIDSAGKIVVGGSTANAMVVVRYISDDAVPPPPVFIDGSGNLVVQGTSGDDTISVSSSVAGLKVKLNNVSYGPFSPTGRIEITAGDGADTINIAAGITIGADIDAGIGNDTINAGAGNDLINGGDGDDVINGRDGNDTLIGAAGNDSINGGTGNDIIEGDAGNDTLRGGDGNDSLDGGDDNDNIIGGADNDTAIGGSGDDFVANDGGDDQLFGGIGNDTLQCGGGADVAHGGDGNDSITGGQGNDTLYGEAGNDIINGGAGDDVIDGGADNDNLNGGAGADIVVAGDGDDVVQGGSERDILIGGAGADSLAGNADDDVLISGTTSHDGDIVALQNAMAVWNSAATYAIRVSTLQGNSFTADVTVFNDTSVDTLTGGAGTDWFIYNSRDGGVIDIVDQKAAETGTDVDVTP